MAKRKRTSKQEHLPPKRPAKRLDRPESLEPDPATGYTADPFIASDLSLHELFEQQTRQFLDSTELSEEQKQSLLVGMSCPCCGGGGMSFTAKITRRT